MLLLIVSIPVLLDFHPFSLLLILFIPVLLEFQSFILTEIAYQLALGMAYTAVNTIYHLLLYLIGMHILPKYVEISYFSYNA